MKNPNLSPEDVTGLSDLVLYRVEIVPGVSAAVVVVVIAPEAVGRISRPLFCSPR